MRDLNHLDKKWLQISKTNSNGQSQNIEEIKIPEENPPLTLLNKRLNMNLGEKYAKLVVLINKLRSDAIAERINKEVEE